MAEAKCSIREISCQPEVPSGADELTSEPMSVSPVAKSDTNTDELVCEHADFADMLGIIRHQSLPQQNFAAKICTNDASLESVWEIIVELPELPPEKLVRLFDHFTVDEVRSIIKGGSLKTERDLDAILDNVDTIYRMRTMYDEVVEAQKKRNPSRGVIFGTVFFAHLPSKVFFGPLKDRFIPFLEKVKEVFAFPEYPALDRFLNICRSLRFPEEFEPKIIENADTLFNFLDSRLKPKEFVWTDLMAYLGALEMGGLIGYVMSRNEPMSTSNNVSEILYFKPDLNTFDLADLPKVTEAARLFANSVFSGLACESDTYCRPIDREAVISEVGISLIRENYDLISKHYTAFREFLRRAKINQNFYGAAFIFLVYLPRDMLENNLDMLVAIVNSKGTDVDKFNVLYGYDNLFQALNKISSREYFKPVAKLLIGRSTSAILMFDYFEKINYPIERLEELLKGSGLVGLEDVFFNYRTKKDIRKLSPDNKDTYALLFESLRKAGLTEVEEDLINSFDCEEFIDGLKKKDFIEASAAIEQIANVTDPRVRDILYRKLLEKSTFGLESIAETLIKWVNPKSGSIDITQLNIAAANALLGLLEWISKNGGASEDINVALGEVFPDYLPQPDMQSAIEWLVGKFDVEEIDFARLRGLGLLTEYMQLRDNVDRLKNTPATRYLTNKFLEFDFTSILEADDGSADGDSGRFRAIENLRRSVNLQKRSFGDELVNAIGISFLDKHPAGFDTISEILRFARTWAIPGGIIDKDVRDLYTEKSYFAYAEVAEFITNGLRDCGDSGSKLDAFVAEFKRRGLDFEQIVDELGSRGLDVRKQSNLSKGLSRIFTHPSYTVNRAAQKVLVSSSANYDRKRVSFVSNNWPQRTGKVEIKDVMYDGEKVATAIKCQRKHTAVRILADRSGAVDMKKVSAELGDRYVFSAPLTMTTGQRKMTEMVFREGEQINWLMSRSGKDGLLVVSSSGEPKILDKREIVLKDLIGSEDLENPGIKAACDKWWKGQGKSGECTQDVLDMPIHVAERVRDKQLFMAILKEKKMSLLPGMLLIKDGETYPVEINPTSQRFFVEFEDGTFGTMDSEKGMTPTDLTELSLAAGVKRAVYMDTGMYDMATYRDARGVDHVLGHADTDESTNRVVIFER